MQQSAPALKAPIVAPPLHPNHRRRGKFQDPNFTAEGEARATVSFSGYKILWFNTGTLCNLTCRNCYIESSPRNDRLSYLTRSEVRRFLEEARRLPDAPSEIGFTGGEPFMNPEILGILEDSLAGDFRVLVLTNAMKPMQRLQPALLRLQDRFASLLSIRVSLDHYSAEEHERLRGHGTWLPTIEGLRFLSSGGFETTVAGRTVWGESDASMRAGYAALFAKHGIRVDASDPAQLILFPEMDPDEDVPEISESCWHKLGKHPDEMMCASSRMVVKRKGADRPSVVACTLLPYAKTFEMGTSLAAAQGTVRLNHSHCARFCVLGGASCGAHR
jgi:pyruvate-formate lyase-activating enzyme